MGRRVAWVVVALTVMLALDKSSSRPLNSLDSRILTELCASMNATVLTAYAQDIFPQSLIGWTNCSDAVNACDSPWTFLECDAAGDQLLSLAFLFRSTSLSPFAGATLPPALGTLSALRNLSLRGTGFVGLLPTPITWTTLETLELIDNNFTGTLPNLSDNLNLSVLYVERSPHLTGTIPSYLGYLSKMKYIELVDVGLVGSIPDEWSNLKGTMQGLVLSKLNLTGTIPGWVTSFIGLQYFGLSSPNLGGTLPDISDWIDLTYIEIFQTPLLKGNQQFLSSIGPKHGNLGIIVLEVQNELVTIPSSLFYDGCPYKQVHLYGKGYVGSIPETISLAKSMSLLEISGSNITGAIPAGLASLYELTQLYMSGSKLTGSIPLELFGQNHSEPMTLDLSYNYFTTFPSQFNNGSFAFLILLGNPNLTGCFPEVSLTSPTSYCDLMETHVCCGPPSSSCRRSEDCVKNCSCNVPPATPSPSAGCPALQVDYQPYFSCINGTWVATSQVAVPTGVLNVSSTPFFINSSLVVSNSATVNVQSSLTVFSDFTLSSSASLVIGPSASLPTSAQLLVYGNFIAEPNSTLSVSVGEPSTTQPTPPPISVSGCISAPGSINVTLPAGDTRTQIPIIKGMQCANGTIETTILSVRYADCIANQDATNLQFASGSLTVFVDLSKSNCGVKSSTTNSHPVDAVYLATIIFSSWMIM